MRAKAHIIYKHDGVRVPGVTTVIGLRAKPGLIKWANNLGLKGIDSAKFTDDKAAIGSLAHDMILCHFKGAEADTSDYSKNQIDEAENALLSFYAWEKGKDIEVILAEYPLTCPQGYGGTPDLYCKLDGVLTLVDFKTGSGIYEPEHPAQLTAYINLLKYNGYGVEQGIILNIPRAENENFDARTYVDLLAYSEWFFTLLTLYKIEARMKKEGK
jgi:hypothetical protein